MGEGGGVDWLARRNGGMVFSVARVESCNARSAKEIQVLREWIVRKGNQARATAYGIVFFLKLESLERNVLRIFQIGPLEAWENVIQRGTTCLWEHLKYGV